MKTITIISTILLLAVCLQAQETKEIPIVTKGGKPHVSVRIGSVVIPDILLDTGMSFDGVMVYNPVYADSLDLSGAVQVQVGGAGSGDAPTALMIDPAEFFLGETKMENQRIIFLQSDIYKGFPSNGIIGYSIYGHYITGFDFDKNIMTLSDTGKLEIDSSWTGIPLYFKNNSIPWLDAAVVIEDEAPVSLSMYIDGAAGDVVLLLERPDMKCSLPKETTNVLLGTGLSGDIYGKTGKISKLIIGPYELTNVTASVAPAEVRSKQDRADAILGNGALRRFNLIFDYAGKMLYLKPNTHFYESFN